MGRRFPSRSRKGVYVDVEWEESSYRTPSAEHRLLVAIVRRAVWDFVLYRGADPVTDKERYDLAADAAGWLFWDGEEEIDDCGRYSFKYICTVLELDAKSIRKGVLALTRKDIQRLNNHIKDD